MKNKGVIIAVIAAVAALLISTGIAVAAGYSSSGKAGVSARGEVPAGVKAASEFKCHNQGESGEVRIKNCAEEQNGNCNGDCDRDQARLRDGSCDGTCDGDGAQNQTQSQYQRRGEEGAGLQNGAGQQNAAGLQNGNCNGDCDRDQARLRDGSCDGTRDGDGAQNQWRGNPQPEDGAAR